MNPKERIDELTTLLTEANYQYYVLDAPTMLDFEYDRMLRELEGFFLSEELAPQVTVRSKKASRVDAKAFVNGGRIIVPVTADGPGEAEAVIVVKGVKKPLKSRYGFTVRNSDGTYTFKAQNVASDILEGEL